jgi:hypothetical protein
VIDLKSQAEKGAAMGDKGGKKDKEKNKQQQVKKHKQGEQQKHDKAPQEAVKTDSRLKGA